MGLPPPNYFRNALRLNLKTSISTIPNLNHLNHDRKKRAASRASPMAHSSVFSKCRLAVLKLGILAGPKAVFDSESNESLRVQLA
jgi:hypothetical protein